MDCYRRWLLYTLIDDSRASGNVRFIITHRHRCSNRLEQSSIIRFLFCLYVHWQTGGCDDAVNKIDFMSMGISLPFLRQHWLEWWLDKSLILQVIHELPLWRVFAFRCCFLLTLPSDKVLSYVEKMFEFLVKKLFSFYQGSIFTVCFKVFQQLLSRFHFHGS